MHIEKAGMGAVKIWGDKLAENKMEQVAKILGTSLNEVFMVYEPTYEIKCEAVIDYKGLRIKINNDWYYDCALLLHLLTGGVKVYELYYEDDYGEHYVDTFESKEEAEDKAEYIRDEYGNIPINIVSRRKNEKK